MDSARHVIGCHLTHETMGQNACDDVSSTIHQSLNGGALEGAGVGVPRGVHVSRDRGGSGESRSDRATPISGRLRWTHGLRARGCHFRKLDRVYSLLELSS